MSQHGHVSRIGGLVQRKPEFTYWFPQKGLVMSHLICLCHLKNVVEQTLQLLVIWDTGSCCDAIAMYGILNNYLFLFFLLSNPAYDAKNFGFV